MQIILDRLMKGAVVNSKMLKDLIKAHEQTRIRTSGLYERYKASKEGVPILTRTFEDDSKVNNKLNNDFFSDIIDTKVGYFAGRPISYMVDDEQKVKDEWDLFYRRNNIPDLDSEIVKMMAVAGHAVRLLYIDRDGNERACNVPPWEVIFLYEEGIEKPFFAMRYYLMEREISPNFWQEVTCVEWYDESEITFWAENGKGGDFILDPYREQNPLSHNFDFVPLIGFSNNEELQGDCEKVLELIDGYDRTFSDVNSEIEQFRLAYLATYGVEIDEEVLEKAKRTGAFGFPDTESKMEFITKSMDGALVESHLDRLENNIMRFAKSVNLTDEEFSGNASGVALRYKMFGLESKCITAERKMITALRRMFEILSTAWAKRNLIFDHMMMDFQFTRNFPLNLLDEAQTSQTLKGLVSDKTRLSLLTFVEDVDAELERLEEEYVPPVIEEEPEEEQDEDDAEV